MKNKDTQLLEEAYAKVHNLKHFKLNDPEVLEYVASLDGIEVDPDLDFEGQQEGYTSGTASINTTLFPKTYNTLLDLAKQNKIKVVGGPTSVNMSGRAVTVR